MVAQENNFVEKYIKLRHKIMRATWTDEASKWTVTVQNLETGQEFEDQVDIIIDGGGVLNRWKWPDIEGLNGFTGDLLHSANWNQGCDLTNKRVALIGAGSSGVQILPNIYDRVSKVYTWVRNRIWITAGFAQAFSYTRMSSANYFPTQIPTLPIGKQSRTNSIVALDSSSMALRRKKMLENFRRMK